MKLDVYFSPSALTNADVQGRVVVVIDVLRASTTMAVALANGARSVVPFESAEDAITRSKSFERSDILLAGERRMMPIAGFDLGNSPGGFTQDIVEGKSILFTTTNGTAALFATQGAKEVLVGAFVNHAAVVAALRKAIRDGLDVALLCAGSERHFALEDAVCAGRFVRALARRLTTIELNDAAQVAQLVEKRYRTDLPALFRDATHGKALVEAGFAADVELCATLDSHPVVPVFAERLVTLAGPRRGR